MYVATITTLVISCRISSRVRALVPNVWLERHVEGEVTVSILVLVRCWARRIVTLSFNTRMKASSNSMTAVHFHTLHRTD